MANSVNNANLHMPQVSGSPGSVKQPAQARDPIAGSDSAVKNSGQTESFEKVLGAQLGSAQATPQSMLAGGSVTEPLKFSAHANARLQSRKLEMGPEQMRKLNEAVDKAAAKGLDDALVLSKDGAFIVSVKNRTVVTALDRNSMDGNVFTNIDGAVVI